MFNYTGSVQIETKQLKIFTWELQMNKYNTFSQFLLLELVSYFFKNSSLFIVV